MSWRVIEAGKGLTLSKRLTLYSTAYRGKLKNIPLTRHRVSPLSICQNFHRHDHDDDEGDVYSLDEKLLQNIINIL